MPVTVSTPKSSEPLPKVDFTWDPVGAAVSFSFAGNSYPPAGARFAAYYTPVNQLVTFTAQVTATPNAPIIAYRWDLGDGVTKFGSTIGHVYNVPNPSLTAKLEVTDSLNRKVYVSKVLLLQVQFATQVSGKARV
jgi:hypothetical protein